MWKHLLFTSSVCAAFSIGFIYATPTRPTTLPALTNAIGVEQQRLEARLTGLLHYCIRGNQLLRSKPGCEELAQYVTQQADEAERHGR